MLPHKPKLLNAFRLLRIEFGRLRRVYDASVYSFATTRELLQKQLESGEITASTKILIPNTERVLAWSPLELLQRMNETYPEMLRASLLIRAVSQMENYLVALLSEIAERSLVPFKLQDKIVSFSQAQLLSFETAEKLKSHLIQAECRGLNGKGFRDFEKYYKKRFNIAFSQSPVAVEEVDGIYSRRHVLVHAGGVIDDQFRKRFSPDAHPGQQLEISEQYFLEATKKLEALAEYCALRVETLFPKNIEIVAPPIALFIEEFSQSLFDLRNQVREPSVAVIHWFDAQFRTPELLNAHFSENSTFKIGEQPHKLELILAGKKRTGEKTIQWLVCGEKNIVGAYIGYLAFLSRRGMLEEFEKHHIMLKKGFISEVGKKQVTTSAKDN